MAFVASGFCGFCGFWLLWLLWLLCLLNSLLLMTLLVKISHFDPLQRLLLITFLVTSLFFNDFCIEISLLMSFPLHSLLLMTLLDKISTCNVFSIENHTDHQKIQQFPIKVPTVWIFTRLCSAWPVGFLARQRRTMWRSLTLVVGAVAVIGGGVRSRFAINGWSW